jgi:hypothetical protein
MGRTLNNMDAPMETLQLTGLLAIFLVTTLLMFYRILPALLALPLMAVLLALVGGVAPNDVMQMVVGKGAIKLHGAYTIAIFGGMLSILLQKTKVAESFIKKGAELSGDNPWLIAVIMLLLIVMLFSTLGGLGAIIMVATIVLPVMASVGIGPMTCVGIFLMGISIGGTLNVGNWALYTTVMGLKVEQVRPFALIMFVLGLVAALLYVTIQLYRDGQNLNFKKIARNMALTLALVGGGLGAYFFALTPDQQALIGQGLGTLGIGLKWLTGLGLSALTLAVIIRAVQPQTQGDDVHWLSFFGPLVPLLLILVFSLDFTAAFIAGLLYTFVATYRKGRLNVLIQACLEGGSVVMPSVLLMFGIGMILVAIMGPGGDLPNYPNGWPVLNLLKPITNYLIPGNAVVYVLMFTALTPLALYRGPLNLWGMGYGIAAVFLAGGMPPAAVMGLLMSVGQVQGISDPTNTQNVWLANEMRVDVQKVLWNTLPYAWGLSAAGLICAATLYMRG